MKLFSFFIAFLLFVSSVTAETLVINDPKDGWLNLRSGPGTSYRVIQRMDNGLRVEEQERRGNWSNVVLPNGVTGWAYRKYMFAANTSGSGTTSSDRWSYADGEAGWNLMHNGKMVASVFLGIDVNTKDYYFGFSRVSNDPMIYVMGVSVAHSGGRTTELNAEGCYGATCIQEYISGGGTVAEVTIPILSSDEAAILEALKSARDITFRYQSRASYAENSYKTMKLGLKGSRDAIEKVETFARQLRTQTPATAATKPATTPFSTSAPASSSSTNTLTQSTPEIKPDGSGKSFLVNDTKHGDRFCDAAEMDAYPPQLYAPQMKVLGNLADAYNEKYTNPVSLDFLGRGTSVWDGFPPAGDLALYRNGAAIGRGTNIRGSTIYENEEKWRGSWQISGGGGLKIRMKSIEKLSWGHQYFECSHGFMTDARESGNRPTTDKNGKPVMKKAAWRGCGIYIYCQTWTDEHPEKKDGVVERLPLVEWSTSIIPPEKLRWVER